MEGRYELFWLVFLLYDPGHYPGASDVYKRQILGMLAVGSIREAEQGRRRKAARRRQGSGRSAQSVGRPKQALYVVDLSRQEPSHSRAA